MKAPMTMAARLCASYRWLPAGLLALAGCVTPLSRPLEDLPPAQVELTPPQPITRPLPRVTRAAPEAGAAKPAPTEPAQNAEGDLNDLILGRRPPAVTPPRPPQPPALPPVRPPPLAPAPPPPVPPAGPLTFRRIIALQTLLDRQNFSCNCADGRIGSRTRAALRAWQEAHGVPVTGEADAATLAKLGPLDSLFTTYTVTAADHAALVTLPKTWLGKSQMQRLGYATILETVAERGHATQQAIRDLNPGVTAWPDPPAGTALTLPDPGPEANGGGDVHAARVRISISRKLVRAYDGAGLLIAQFPCSIARDPKKREPCDISVVALAPDPNYSFDPALFSEDPESATLKTKLIIPPGPRNPVGSAWVGLSKTGYGIHGTPHPEDIGKTESHGCFRLANWNARKLLHLVEIGTPVTVEE